MDLALRTVTKYVEDRTWLSSPLAARTHTATLDYSAFTSGTHYPLGYIPSGTAVAKLASGLYGPASDSDDETQTITIDATGGTFTISIAGETTAALDFDSTAAEVETALHDLFNVEDTDVTVTGGPGATAPFTLTFGGNLAGENVPAVTTAAGSLTGGAGTAVVATTNAGSNAAGTPRGLLFNSTDVSGAADVGVAVMHAGDIRSSNLPANSGWSDDIAAALAGAVTDLDA